MNLFENLTAALPCIVEAMFFVEANPCGKQDVPDALPCAAIELLAPLHGWLYIATDPAVAASLAANLAFAPYDSDPGPLLLAELANQVAGATLALTAPGEATRLGLPRYGRLVAPVPGGLATTFSTDDGLLYVSITTTEPSLAA